MKDLVTMVEAKEAESQAQMEELQVGNFQDHCRLTMGTYTA